MISIYPFFNKIKIRQISHTIKTNINKIPFFIKYKNKNKSEFSRLKIKVRY